MQTFDFMKMVTAGIRTFTDEELKEVLSEEQLQELKGAEFSLETAYDFIISHEEYDAEQVIRELEITFSDIHDNFDICDIIYEYGEDQILDNMDDQELLCHISSNIDVHRFLEEKDCSLNEVVSALVTVFGDQLDFDEDLEEAFEKNGVEITTKSKTIEDMTDFELLQAIKHRQEESVRSTQDVLISLMKAVELERQVREHSIKEAKESK